MAPGSEDELVRIWLESADPQGVSAAANTIVAQLANDPDAQGTYLLAGLRLYTQPPLRVIYRVRKDDCLASDVYIKSLE